MARHSGQKTISWTINNHENVAHIIATYGKSKGYEKLKDFTSSDVNRVIDIICATMISIDKRWNDKKGGIRNMVKWALTQQTDVSLVKSHPQGLKYKTIYQSVLLPQRGFFK